MTDELARLNAALGQQYQVEREVGAGGMATVYLAHDVRHGREVAIKVLRAEIAGTLGADRFLREIAVTARLDHPNILPLLDSGNADGLLYYVMPYVRGESLRARLARERQLPIDDALEITRSVSDALSYAHQMGIVHRDVKPDNILLSGNHARVADFGIARALREISGNTITGTGIVVGSPAYMSPEQAAGDRDLDGRSDVYAVGCVLYEMLAGQPPFSGPTQESIIRQHIIAPPPDVTQLRPTVPASVSMALTRALAKAPADRFQTPEQLYLAARTDVVGDGTRSGTRDGKHTQGERASASIGSRFTTRVRFVATLLLAIALASAAYVRFASKSTVPPSTSPATSDRPRVAVLPFRNIGALEDEYIADGLTEEITSRLSGISGMVTISRTTALTYKGSTKPLPEIARELGVAYVLVGTVRTERLANGDGRILVTPELVGVDSDSPVWTDRMNAGLAPGALFAVQAQIADRVASAFNVTVLARERSAINRIETVSAVAHDAYLRGRFSRTKATDSDLLSAIEYFKRAVAADPLYARAYAGLADAYSTAPFYPQTNLTDKEAFDSAAINARHAIALDSTLGDAHAALGSVLADGAWKWAEADSEFATALRFDPDNTSLHIRRSALLMRMRQYQAALIEAERALQLEPGSRDVLDNYAVGLTYLGRLDEAVEYEQRALALDSTFLFAHVWLAEIAAIRNDLPMMGKEFGYLLPMKEVGRALGQLGTSTASRRDVVAAIKAIRSPNAGLDAGRHGWLFAVIGEVNASLDAFEIAIRLRSPGGLSAMQFPSVQRALQSSPRYRALLQSAGIPVVAP